MPPDLTAAWDDLIGRFVGGIAKVLDEWSGTVATSTAKGLDDLMRPAIDWFRADTANFVLHTPLSLVNILSGYIGLGDFHRLLQSVAATAFILAAIAYTGHERWGWPPIDDSVQRIAVTVMIVGASDRLLDASLSLVDALVNAIASSMPTLPPLDGFHPIVLVCMVTFWVVLFGRLALVMGKRIVWLAVLKALAPLALMTMAHYKTAWISGTFGRLWVGWLIGQIIVVVVLVLAVAFVALGGFLGYILSCACLMVAHDAVYIFAPKDAGPSITVGRLRIGG